MDTQVAQIVLYSIAAVGFVAWLAGLAFVAATARSDRPEAAPGADDPAFGGESPPPRGIAGGMELEGGVADLSGRLTEALVQPLKAGMQVRIVERSDARVVFDILGLGPFGVGPGRPRRGWVRFRPIGSGRTLAEYAIEGPGGRWMLAAASAFLVLGLLALGLGLWACRTYLLPDPSYRPQVVQMVQAVHFLWPPFLFAGLYRDRDRMVRRSFETLLANLPYG